MHCFFLGKFPPPPLSTVVLISHSEWMAEKHRQTNLLLLESDLSSPSRLLKYCRV